MTGHLVRKKGNFVCIKINPTSLYFSSVVGCRRPPVPTHGSTEGLFHHSGARITFRCDPGFELKGFRHAICLSDGTWSAPAPDCGRIIIQIGFFPLQNNYNFISGKVIQYACL